jgi:hypothetical protein
MMPSCNNFPVLSQADTIYYTGPVLPATFTAQSNSTIICSGSTVTLSAQIVPGFPNSYYAWGIVGEGYSFGGDTLLTQSWMPTGYYYCNLSNFCGNSINSNLIHITNVKSDVTATSIASLCANPGGVIFKLVKPIAGATYQWRYNGVAIPGATDTSYLATQPGLYRCVVTFQTCVDSLGSGGYLAPSSFTISAFTIPPSCGQCDGFAQLTSIGSLLYYPNYLWNDGATTYTRNNLCPGTYTVTATDQGGCTASTTFTIASQGAVTINQSNAVAPTNGQCNGSVNLNYSGGTPPYNISFNPPVPLSGYCENTTYIVTVTDSNGCASIDSVLFYNDNDSVWPGDANHDGVADNLDMLAIGIGMGSSQYARANISNTWQPYPSVNWETTLLSGTDYKHIDCDGNGTIDLSDTTAIIQNFGNTHLKPITITETNLAAPPLFFEILNDSVLAGGAVSLTIEMGDALNIADSIYGMAFSIGYNPALVIGSTLQFHLDSSWLGNGTTTDLISIQKNDVVGGVLKVGATRTNHQNSNGYGKIGTLTFNLVNNLTVWHDTLWLTFNSLTVIDKDEQIKIINSQSNYLVVWDNTWLGINNPDGDFNFSIYPNPAQNEINIFSQQKVTIQMFDALNKMLFEKNIEPGKTSFNIAAIANGIYLMKVTNSKTSKMMKVLVNR